jgi:hypothetical protein
MTGGRFTGMASILTDFETAWQETCRVPPDEHTAERDQPLPKNENQVDPTRAGDGRAIFHPSTLAFGYRSI